MSLSSITVREGKTIVLRRGKKTGPRLYAMNQQTSQNNVEIIYLEHNQMAFKFPDRNRDYYMAVQGSDLRLMEAAPVSNTASLPPSYLFKKVSRGAHYGLISVEMPSKYIASSRQHPNLLVLSDNYTECLLIRDEHKNTATD